MGILNHNIRFIRKKNGLSQSKLAELAGVNRGNIDSYEKNSQPKPEFLVILAKEFNIDMQMMLANRMTEENYQEFVLRDEKKEIKSPDNEASGPRRFKKSEFFNLMQKIKETDNYSDRQVLVDSALEMVSRLEDEKSEMQEELVGLVRKLRSF